MKRRPPLLTSLPNDASRDDPSRNALSAAICAAKLSQYCEALRAKLPQCEALAAAMGARLQSNNRRAIAKPCKVRGGGAFHGAGMKPVGARGSCPRGLSGCAVVRKSGAASDRDNELF